MADYRTEEEQIELLKKWWRENGRSVIAGVVIALVAFIGWSQWQAYQARRMDAAADLYQQLADATAAADSAQKASALAEQLRTDYANTVYGIFAGLHLAKDAIKANNLSRAAEQLAWVQQQRPDASLQPLVSLRVAQVQYAQNELDQALATLNGIKGKNMAWQAAIAELRGDIEAEQGKTEQARNSYQDALKSLETAGNRERGAVLEVKLSSLVSAKVVTGTQP